MTEPENSSNQPEILQDAARHFLSDGTPRVAEVELAPDLLNKLQALAEARELTEAEAVLMAVAAGLSFLSGEGGSASEPGTGGQNSDEGASLRSRLVKFEASYAVMKHRLWLALQANQTMSLRDGALTAAIEGLRNVVERLKAELAEAQKLGATTPAHAHQETRPVASLANAPRRRNLARRLWAAIRREP